jgi:hypothetical protein
LLVDEMFEELFDLRILREVCKVVNIQAQWQRGGGITRTWRVVMIPTKAGVETWVMCTGYKADKA